MLLGYVADILGPFLGLCWEICGQLLGHRLEENISCKTMEKLCNFLTPTAGGKTMLFGRKIMLFGLNSAPRRLLGTRMGGYFSCRAPGAFENLQNLQKPKGNQFFREQKQQIV